MAARTGVTVRTLHHYDHVGLVSPSSRSAAGHRRYSDADVSRLYRVLALRQLGLGLEEIGDVLAGDLPLPAVLTAHLARVDEQVGVLQRLQSLLRSALERGVGPEDVLDLLREVTTVDETTFDRYFTPEQREVLEERRQALGPAVEAAQQRWPQLIAEVEAAVADGTDPASARGQELAAEWRGLLEQFHGGDEGLRSSLFRMREENAEEVQARYGGPSATTIDFITRANAAG
ncbi:MerR family transcriptional regulator [Kineococcus sp. R8]|nr:MerR family transcriptional regulator [Kineococcus siccus]NAZ82279.1 MerR family transcriptional regulator [Kineococcus siccus]